MKPAMFLNERTAALNMLIELYGSVTSRVNASNRFRWTTRHRPTPSSGRNRYAPVFTTLRFRRNAFRAETRSSFGLRPKSERPELSSRASVSTVVRNGCRSVERTFETEKKPNVATEIPGLSFELRNLETFDSIRIVYPTKSRRRFADRPSYGYVYVHIRFSPSGVVFTNVYANQRQFYCTTMFPVNGRTTTRTSVERPR